MLPRRRPAMVYRPSRIASLCSHVAALLNTAGSTKRSKRSRNNRWLLLGPHQRGRQLPVPLGLILEIEIGDLLAVGVLHDEGFLTFLDRPGRREAAGHSW